MKRREDDKAMLERHWMIYDFNLSSLSWKRHLNMCNIKNVSETGGSVTRKAEKGEKTKGEWRFTF